ncbi:MAG: glycosyltransferase family 1 protein [Chitinophagaceae bacterium]|nr:MAG: glycosyltransferase family 1 protein [Chitinophagaceae bacterium]
MRIAIYTDIIPEEKETWKGADWFIYEVIYRMTAMHPEHEFIIISNESFDSPHFPSGNLKYVSLASSPSSKFSLYRLLKWTLPSLLKKEKAEAFLSLNGFLPLKSKIPSCIVLQDTSFLFTPAAVSDRKLNYLKSHIQPYLSKAGSIATVSAFCKKELVSRFNIPPEKMTVIHKGIQEDFHPLSWQEREAVKNDYTDGREYFIYAGNISKDKNIINMLKGFSVLKKRLRSNMVLILAGKEDTGYKEFPELMRSYHFRDDVKRMGQVGLQEMTKLIGAAYALVSPSETESYNSPVTEALRCKVPVLAAAGSVCEELAGDAALYFNPIVPDNIGDKFCEIYKDENLRAGLIANTDKQATQFNWDKTADLLWDCIMQIVK